MGFSRLNKEVVDHPMKRCLIIASFQASLEKISARLWRLARPQLDVNISRARSQNDEPSSYRLRSVRTRHGLCVRRLVCTRPRPVELGEDNRRRFGTSFRVPLVYLICFYLKSFFRLMLCSESFRMTLLTAISKSSWVTCTRRSRKAYMPASVQTAFISAPLAPPICFAILLKSMPRMRFIFREWIRRMSSLASSPGLGNSILRSIRPDLRRAGSRMSTRLVAAMTLTRSSEENPSS
mmetsp:Transcript_6939/g.14368  ORF Transcript_6939/g.14368 Transcript_6939/m.14368 type:complete len:237 (+) Transcript_6939:1727-2437(+)